MWKILFNPELTKPAQESIFSKKKGDSAHPNILFDGMSVERASHQDHLGIYLDEKSNFKMHIETVLCNVKKIISIRKKLRHTLPRSFY